MMDRNKTISDLRASVKMYKVGKLRKYQPGIFRLIIDGSDRKM